MLLGGSFGRGMIDLLAAANPAGSFTAWKTANGTTQTMAQDHDNDGVPNGVEWFLGGNTATSGLTALPGVVSSGGVSSVTWAKAAVFTGTYGTDFVIETCDTFGGERVAETVGGNVTITGNAVKYTFPAPVSSKKFVRLKVTAGL